MRWRETAGKHLAEETPRDEQNADNDVGSVETRDHEKRRTVDPTMVEPKPFVVQVHPLKDLDSDKRRSQKNREAEQGKPRFSFLHGDFAEVKSKATRDEENGIDRSKEDGQVRIAVRWPRVVLLPSGIVRRDGVPRGEGN